MNYTSRFRFRTLLSIVQIHDLEFRERVKILTFLYNFVSHFSSAFRNSYIIVCFRAVIEISAHECVFENLNCTG